MAKEPQTKTQQEQQERGSGEERNQGQQERGPGEERNLAQRRAAVPATPARVLGSPFTLMRQFMQDLDELFDAFSGRRPNGQQDAAWLPAVEVAERDGQLVVRADVPGLSKDQIRVEVEDGQLIISGERTQENEEKGEGFVRSERTYGSFYRAIPLPEGVDPEQAKATFANGVLEITMPEAPAPKGQRVEVQEGSQAQQQGQQTKQESKKQESHAA